MTLNNKKHLKNVGPIRHCEPPRALILHFHSPGVATVARRHCRTPPAHRCPRQQQQRQRVTEGSAMAPWNGPNYMCAEDLRCGNEIFSVFTGDRSSTSNVR